MHISSLRIQNYKSLLDLTIEAPNPFSVFVGPNGAGKSNIFEALEYLNYHQRVELNTVDTLFGGAANFLNFKPSHAGIKPNETMIRFILNFGDISNSSILLKFFDLNELSWKSRSSNFVEFTEQDIRELKLKDPIKYNTYAQFYQNFSRLFIGNHSLVKIPFKDDSRLALDAGNLEKVLKRVLQDEQKREEMTEWLQLLIPGFERISIHSDSISGVDTFLLYEQGTNKPFTKALISDGTYNILALLTAIYQSDEPQFLCIEEPENGLNPKVIRELVQLFRQQCEENGHYIWLNTHSQTLVAELEPKEIILVDKVNGATRVKQFKDADLHGLRMDEAWLTNALGGGLPW